MWKIYAPVKETNGVRASVRFVNGVGETKNPALMEWFKKHHYRVEKCEEITENSIEKCVEDESPKMEMTPIAPVEESEKVEVADQPDFESMTPLELRDYAKANGLGLMIGNIRNKERLLEIVRG